MSNNTLWCNCGFICSACLKNELGMKIHLFINKCLSSSNSIGICISPITICNPMPTVVKKYWPCCTCMLMEITN